MVEGDYVSCIKIDPFTKIDVNKRISTAQLSYIQYAKIKMIDPILYFQINPHLPVGTCS